MKILKCNKGFAFIELVVLLAIICILSSMIICTFRSSKSIIQKRERNAKQLYNGWVKQYGNPNELTQEEFEASRTVKDTYGRIINVLPPVKTNKDTNEYKQPEVIIEY